MALLSFCCFGCISRGRGYDEGRGLCVVCGRGGWGWVMEGYGWVVMWIESSR